MREAHVLKQSGDSQEEVQAPAASVSRNVGTYTSVQPTDAMRRINVPQRPIDGFSDTSLRVFGRHLKFHLEEV